MVIVPLDGKNSKESGILLGSNTTSSDSSSLISENGSKFITSDEVAAYSTGLPITASRIFSAFLKRALPTIHKRRALFILCL
jgi:hypothetical protein